MDCGKNWIVDFNTGKTLLVSFHRSNNNGTIDMKMDGSIIEEKSSFKMLILTFSSKLDWVFYILSVAKTASKKIGALIHFMKFFFPEVALTTRKLSKYGVTSGLYFPVFGLNMGSDTPCLSVFSLNTGKYGSEITPYLDTFHSVPVSL